jgi:hypothetical protein
METPQDTTPATKPPRNRTALLVTIAGLIAVFFAVVLNLAPVESGEAVRALGEGLVFALVAIACGIWCLRRGQRFLAVAMIAPSVFVLAEGAMRLVFLVQHGQSI